MDSAKLSFLAAVLGDEGAQALSKAAARYEPLEDVLIPRAALSWLSITARTGYEGEIPGVPGSYLSFMKNEGTDLFAGQLSVNGESHPFENASVLHIVAGVSVALNADVSADHRLKDSDLVNLGRQVDLLTKAEFVGRFEDLRKTEPPKKTVTMYHVGRDFDQFDPSQIGTGEGSRGAALNPLGPGLYGTVAEPGAEEAAKRTALQYAKYHQDPHLHTFEVDLDPAGTGFGAHNHHTRDFNLDELGNRNDRLAQATGVKYPDPDILTRKLGNVKANAMLRQHGISARMTNLHNGVIEMAVYDPAKLRRVSKVRVADMQKSEIEIQLREAIALTEKNYGEPWVDIHPPKRKRKGKKFTFKKSQLESPCPDCGGTQIEAQSFNGCMCTAELAPFVTLSKSNGDYVAEFGPEWGEDELSLLFSITGRS